MHCAQEGGRTAVGGLRYGTARDGGRCRTDEFSKRSALFLGTELYASVQAY